MATVAGRQMTLEVGDADEDDLSIEGTFTLGGALKAQVELPKNAQVRVTVVSEDGEVVAEGVGRVKTLAFKQQEKDGLKWTERQHKIKLA